MSNYFNAQENQIFYKLIPQIYFPTNFTNGMDVTIDVQNRELRACTQITKARKKGFYFMQSILLQMTRSKRAARKEKKDVNYN